MLSSVMSQCTHVIVFNGEQSTDLPTEVISFPHLRIVKEAWLEACLHECRLVDESNYLLQPSSSESCMGFYVALCVASATFFISSMNYMIEWQKDIESSVDKLFEGSSGYDSVFQRKNFLFLPSIDKSNYPHSFIIQTRTVLPHMLDSKNGGCCGPFSLLPGIYLCVPSPNPKTQSRHIIHYMSLFKTRSETTCRSMLGGYSNSYRV